MDLWHHNLHDHANLVMNRYLDTTRDEHGVALLPFFMALRAAVRAHVVATQAEMAAEISNGLRHEARSYFDLAINLLGPPSPILIAIGGLSGSGKSTIAEALAAHVGSPPGAQIFESDRMRKAMFAVAAATRLADEAYRPEISIAVYKSLCDKAGTALSLLVSVIVDAVFDQPSNRAMIERVASALAVPFVGIWLKGEHSILKSRIAARKNSVSDATVEVLEVQETKDVGAIGWRHIDANLSVDAIVGLVIKEINTARSRSTSTHTSCPR